MSGLRVIDGGGEGSPVIRTADVKPTERRYCGHDHLELIERDRAVMCSDCGAAIDAFTALCKLASEWERHAAWTRAVEAERRRAEEKLAEVKRELANAKARRRSAVKRGDLPPPRG